MESVYTQVKNFKRKFPGSVMWRIKAHSKIIEKHLNPGEVVNYAFAGQKNNVATQIFETCIVAITNKRILIAQKRLFFGYYLNSITPDLYNDMQVVSNIIWGTVVVDTVKETIYISNLSKKSLPEVETAITSFMMKAKNND